MIIPEYIPLDKEGQYCISCFSSKVKRILTDGLTYYHCDSCGKELERSLVIDNKIVWWVDTKTREYWHESVGIFVFNRDNQALFFKRKIFPFVFTIPAGHLDVGEKPKNAVKRELLEETGITVKELKLITQKNIIGDECRRGADIHKWHLYSTTVESATNIKINNEGAQPIWLTLSEALKKELTVPVREFIKNYKSKLL